MASTEGSFTAVASLGIVAGVDLIIPASAFADVRGTAVPGAFPGPYYTYYVSVAGVQLPRLGGMVSPDATAVRVANGASLDPATSISVGPRDTDASNPHSTDVPSSGTEWLHAIHEA